MLFSVLPENNGISYSKNCRDKKGVVLQTRTHKSKSSRSIWCNGDQCNITTHHSIHTNSIVQHRFYFVWNQIIGKFAFAILESHKTIELTNNYPKKNITKSNLPLVLANKLQSKFDVSFSFAPFGLSWLLIYKDWNFKWLYRSVFIFTIAKHYQQMQSANDLSLNLVPNAYSTVETCKFSNRDWFHLNIQSTLDN